MKMAPMHRSLLATENLSYLLTLVCHTDLSFSAFCDVEVLVKSNLGNKHRQKGIKMEAGFWDTPAVRGQGDEEEPAMKSRVERRLGAPSWSLGVFQERRAEKCPVGEPCEGA